MPADLGMKSPTSVRMEKLKEGFFLKTIGTDEEKTQEAEEKTALAEKIKKNQKRTKDPEEVEKALQCVALMDDRHPRIEGAG